MHQFKCDGCLTSYESEDQFVAHTCPGKPKTAQEWFKWIQNRWNSDRRGQGYPEHVIEALELAQQQAFNSGVNSERHKTKVVPEWMKKPFYDLGRKEAIQECLSLKDAPDVWWRIAELLQERE